MDRQTGLLVKLLLRLQSFYKQDSLLFACSRAAKFAFYAPEQNAAIGIDIKISFPWKWFGFSFL